MNRYPDQSTPQPVEAEGSFLRTTLDDFHRGRFQVLQPAGRGHRAGSDALLIAACLPEGASGRLADLGAGAGVAGLSAAAMNPALHTVLVERNPEMAELARKSLALKANSFLSGRVLVLEADVTLTGSLRQQAGLADAVFDHVIMNPPYNHEGQRASPDGMRAEAHVMGLFGLDAWMRTATAILKPGGKLSMIYRAEKLADVIACSQGRFGGLGVIAVHSRADEKAGRILVQMTKGSRAPLSLLPPIVLHEADGSPSAISNRLMNGEARISFS